MQKTKRTGLRLEVVLAPLFLLLVSVVTAFLKPELFSKSMKETNDWILLHFDWLFASAVTFFLALCAITYFSKIGNVRIGGKDAVPILSKSKWFAISLTTTVATGVLFWACAEPMYHMSAPPPFSNAAPLTAESAKFALSTLYTHWSFSPNAIYTVAAIVFALCFYNLKSTFSLSATLTPILPKSWLPKLSPLIDMICLFTLVAGMSASLGTGLLVLAGGVHEFFGGTQATSFMEIFALGSIVVFTFVLTSVSGIQKGIRIISEINLKFFMVMLAVFLLFGPTKFIFSLSFDAVVDYVGNFAQRSLLPLSQGPNREWMRSWTVFYWANWLAWTPITAMFLGRIAYGRTVREMIRVNLIYPSLFAITWISIFGSTTIFYQLRGLDLVGVMKQSGPESIVYEVIRQFPFAKVLSLIFLGKVFLSNVAMANSNTTAMGGLSFHGTSMENPDSPNWIKILWGCLIGGFALLMVGTSGVDGIKMMSSIGGFPSLILVIFIAFGLLKFILKPGELVQSDQEPSSQIQTEAN